MRSVFVLILALLLATQISLAANKVKVIDKIITITAGQTLTDSLMFAKYDVEAYYGFYVIPVLVTGSAFGVEDSLTINYTTIDDIGDISISGQTVGRYQTDRNANIEIYNAVNITGLERFPLSKKMLTPKICHGIKLSITYRGTTNDQIKLVLVLLVH